MLISFLVLIFCIVIIAKSADMLVDSAARIAVSLGVPFLIIGLTVVAFGTSAPEMAVSVTSALDGYGNVAVANVVGSNVFNLCIILGLCALVRPILSSESLVKRDCILLFIGTVFLSLGMLDLYIGKVQGIFFLTILIGYLVYLGFRGRTPETVVAEKVQTERANWKTPILLVLGLAGVIVGAHFLVKSSIGIAQAWGVPEWAIGVTIVAFGTSVPELATSLAAVRKKYYSLSAGNLIGSDIFNMFGVIGIAGSLGGMTFVSSALLDVGLLTITVGLTTIFLRTGYILSRGEGIMLVTLGFARWAHIILTV